ncbi:MAG TPA: preprotein translocase subunit SecY [bacterium]|nr:preprotein translocase subunit SecY [bacterium]
MNVSIANLFKVPEIRNKILVTLGLLLVYRVGFFIPLPGVDFSQMMDQAGAGGGAFGRLMGMVNVLTGGSLQSATLFSLGVMPYISASIIFSLLQKAVPSLERIAKEGASGQRKINQYTRLATVGICLVQSWFVIGGSLSGGSNLLHAGVEQWFGLYTIVVMVALTAGTMFIMWLGEQITEHGIGNGISLIIMAGIIANLPGVIGSLFGSGSLGTEQWQTLLTFGGAWLVTVIAVVFMTKAQRRIPIQQAKQARGRQVYGGQKHFLPFKVNQAGVMPIIFGSALLMIPAMLGTALGITFLEQAFGMQRGFWFVLSFAAMIYFFSFFWTSMMFQPNEIAKNLQEQGSFIPGIRPGKPTAQFLESTMVRITLAGATFLTAIAIMPSLIGTGGSQVSQVLVYFMSGTSILIVVGVALDMVEKIQALLVMRNYEGAMTDASGGAGGTASGWGRRSTT